MKRLAFYTVGTGHGVADSISFSIQRYNPDCLVFFTSSDTREHNEELWNLFGLTPDDFDESQRALRGTIRQGLYSGVSYVFPLDDELDRVNDADTLHLAYRRLMQREFNRQGDGDEPLRKHAIAEFTHGTKPMSAALFGAAYALGIKTLIYTSGERDDTGRVITGTEQSHATRARSLRAVEWTEHAIDLFNRGEYVEAARQARRLDELPEPHLPQRGNISRMIRFASRALEAWERFRFDEAIEHLGRLGDADEVDPAVVGQHLMNKRRRGRVMRHLHEASNCDRNLRLLADVFANAQRRLDEKAFDDALGRLYRALEFTAQLRLHEQFDLSTSNFPMDRVYDDMHVQPNADGQTARMGADSTWTFLTHEGDELGEMYQELLETTELRVAIRQRNTSLLAHGFDPVHEKYARCMSDAIDRLARTGWGDTTWEETLEICEFSRIDGIRL